MTWGWSGRNTVKSTALLDANSTADRTTELSTLAQLQRVLPPEYRDFGKMYVAQEHLSDYKSVADERVYREFMEYLCGNNTRFTGRDANDPRFYTKVPVVVPTDRRIWKPDAQLDDDLTVLDSVDQERIPWGNNHLLHVKGAHAFLRGEYSKRKAFDAYIGALHHIEPQTMEQAWHHFKFVVKQMMPTTEEINAYTARGGRPPPDDARHDPPPTAYYGHDHLNPYHNGGGDDEGDDDDDDGGGGGGGGGGDDDDDDGGGGGGGGDDDDDDGGDNDDDDGGGVGGGDDDGNGGAYVPFGSKGPPPSNRVLRSKKQGGRVLRSRGAGGSRMRILSKAVDDMVKSVNELVMGLTETRLNQAQQPSRPVYEETAEETANRARQAEQLEAYSAMVDTRANSYAGTLERLTNALETSEADNQAEMVAQMREQLERFETERARFAEETKAQQELSKSTIATFNTTMAGLTEALRSERAGAADAEAIERLIQLGEKQQAAMLEHDTRLLEVLEKQAEAHAKQQAEATRALEEIRANIDAERMRANAEAIDGTRQSQERHAAQMAALQAQAVAQNELVAGLLQEVQQLQRQQVKMRRRMDSTRTTLESLDSVRTAEPFGEWPRLRRELQDTVLTAEPNYNSNRSSTVESLDSVRTAEPEAPGTPRPRVPRLNLQQNDEDSARRTAKRIEILRGAATERSPPKNKVLDYREVEAMSSHHARRPRRPRKCRHHREVETYRERTAGSL
jgi:hypothetical protein